MRLGERARTALRKNNLLAVSAACKAVTEADVQSTQRTCLRGLEQVALLGHGVVDVHDCQQQRDELGNLRRQNQGLRTAEVPVACRPSPWHQCVLGSIAMRLPTDLETAWQSIHFGPQTAFK